MADFRLDDPRERIANNDPRTGGLRAEVAHASGSGLGNDPFRGVGAGDEMMPSFLKGLVEPYIKRKQTEEFNKGVVAQLTAGAEVDVLDDAGNLVSNIFGPNHYEQGAAAFRSSQLVAAQAKEWQTTRLPDLMKLPQNELTKVLSADMGKLMTGNKYTDELVQSEFVKALVPTVQLVTQKRVEWQQTQAYNGYVNTIVQNGENLHNYMRERVAAGGEGGDQAADQAHAMNFLGFLTAKPNGMLDERQLSGVKDAVTSLIEKHNFYPLQVLKQSGWLSSKTLGDEVYDKLNERYQLEGRQALKEASEDHSVDIMRLQWRIERAKSPDWKATDGDPHKITPMEYMTEVGRINSSLSRKTGVDLDYIDVEAMRKGGVDVIQAVAEADRQAGNRAFATKERQASDAAKEEAARQKAALSVQAFNQGTVAQGVLTGSVDRSVAEAAAQQAVLNGDFTGLVRNMATNQDVFTMASNTLRAPITASKGLGYTNDVDKARTDWEKLNALSPSAAMAYYKEDYAKIAKVHALTVQGKPPQVAWMAVYGDTLIGPDIPLKYEYQREAPKQIQSWIDKNGPENLLSAFGAGPKAWNESSKRAIRNALTDHVATLQDSNIGLDVIVKGGLEAKQAEGSLEGYGPFMWEQKQGSTPLWKIVGVPKTTLDGAFYREVDARIRKVSGGKVTANSDNFDILRQPNPDGTESVLLFAADGEGKNYSAVFTTKDLKSRVDAESSEKTREAQWKRDVLYGKPGPNLSQALRQVGDVQRAKEAAQAAKPVPTIGEGLKGLGRNVLEGLQDIN